MSSPRDIKMALPEGGNIPRVGKLRLGVKVERMKNDKPISYPSAVDYFVVNEDTSTNRQSAESFHEMYGDEPRELDIVLPAPRTEDVLEGSWRMYGGGGKMKRKCNGTECVVRDDEGTWNGPMPCACEAAGVPLEVRNRKGDLTKNPDHCALRWTLTVMLMRVQGVGCWQLDTGSVMAGEGLTASLRMLESFRGHLQGAQATLRVVPRQGKSGTVYIAELGSLDITPQQALAIASDNAKQVSLPASSLDDEPDPLLDHEQIEAGDVEVATGEMEYEPVTMPPVSKQLTTLGAMERKDLYRLCGIEGPMSGEVAKALLIGKADELNLPFSDPPNVHAILSRLRVVERDSRTPEDAEAFDHFAKTGEVVEAGDQVTLT